MAAGTAFLYRNTPPFYVVASFGTTRPYLQNHICHKIALIRQCRRVYAPFNLIDLADRVRSRQGRLTIRYYIHELLDVSHACTEEELTQDNHVDESVTVLEASPTSTVEDSSVEKCNENCGGIYNLPTIQVQSIQEQEALAATPAHPEGLRALYGTFFAGNIVEHIWNFAWPSAVAILHESLLPVAVISFVSKLLIFICGPWVGARLDSLPRVFAFNSLSVIQAVAQSVSAVALIYALRKPAISSSSVSVFLQQPWFLILLTMQAVERLAGLACGVAFERDWVVLLAGANRPIALAEANAMLSKVDYLCEMAGTSFYGFLLSKCNPTACLKMTAGIVIASLPIMIILAGCTDILSKGVLQRSKISKVRGTFESESDPATLSSRTFGTSSLEMLKHGWIQYLSQPALPVSLAAVFLYFNIALAPGSLMTSFLTQQGMNPSTIGVFNGVGALMGFGATCLSATLIRKLGLLKAGASGLLFQVSLLAIAVSTFWSSSMATFHSYQFFLAAVVLSRLGQFTYEIIGGQILQTAVHPSQANTVGTTEVSLASLAELVMLGVAIIANDVSHFRYLTILSLAAVIGSTVAYYWWMSKAPTFPALDLHV
ncbi:hypothetical protein KP509_36G006600 [Ceratopteris richardii]|uniref:Solute carrier family 40 member n=1 Tax=Ceratopteris richardii TaxID=49495 RepID=A0A8T2QAD6_CERRI|nr:hypothetical protein KP509_36G006600 [Ceratopteris richardii]